MSEGMIASVRGNLMRNTDPFPAFGFNFHPAAQAVEIGLDNVHSHTPAGNVRHLFRR